MRRRRWEGGWERRGREGEGREGGGGKGRGRGRGGGGGGGRESGGHINQAFCIANTRPSALDLWKQARLRTSWTMENSTP